MPFLFASDALLPDGWARDLLLEWNDAGEIVAVSANAASDGHPRAAGPVLPGMPNVHSHAFQRAMAGLAERRGHPTDDFWTWRETMYALVRRLAPEDIGAIASQLDIEMLKHGYTSVAEFHYLHRDAKGNPYADIATLADPIVHAAGISGIALTFLPVMYRFGGFGGRALQGGQRRFASDPGSIMALLAEMRSRHGDRRNFRLGVAPHSVRAVDAMLLTEIVAKARELDPELPIHMHLSEQAREVSECLATHGATPFEWVKDLVDVDSRWCFVHSTHITPKEAEGLASRGAVVGLCPATEANLGDGIFDFAGWFARGAPWAIGGDSHVCVSPFEELRALESSQRLRLGVRNVASSEAAPDVAANLWSGAAHGGGQAIGQPVGRIAPGQRADLVVLDGAHVDFEGATAADALSIAMFGGGANRVRDVFVAGRKVIDAGHHAREADAEGEFRAALRRLRSESS